MAGTAMGVKREEEAEKRCCGEIKIKKMGGEKKSYIVPTRDKWGQQERPGSSAVRDKGRSR